MDSKASTQTVFNNTSVFNNSDVETPDEFLDSEPGPINFSQPLFSPNLPLPLLNPLFLLFSHIDATPVISPLSSKDSDVPSPITDNQLEHDSEEIINHQQYIYNTNNPCNLNLRILYSLCPHCTFLCMHSFMKRKHFHTTPQLSLVALNHLGFIPMAHILLIHQTS